MNGWWNFSLPAPLPCEHRAIPFLPKPPSPRFPPPGFFINPPSLSCWFSQGQNSQNNSSRAGFHPDTSMLKLRTFSHSFQAKAQLLAWNSQSLATEPHSEALPPSPQPSGISWYPLPLPQCFYSVSFLLWPLAHFLPDSTFWVWLGIVVLFCL